MNINATAGKCHIIILHRQDYIQRLKTYTSKCIVSLPTSLVNNVSYFERTLHGHDSERSVQVRRFWRHYRRTPLEPWALTEHLVVVHSVLPSTPLDVTPARRRTIRTCNIWHPNQMHCSLTSGCENHTELKTVDRPTAFLINICILMLSTFQRISKTT